MITISPFTGIAADYAATVAIWNANWPDRPETVAQWQRRDEQRNKEYAFARFVVKEGSQIVAYGGYEEPIWLAGTGTYVLFYEVDPACDHDDIHALICQQVPASVQGVAGAVKLITANLREDKPRKIAFLLANGFVQVMRHPISRLDVTAFNPDPYADLLAKVAATGIRIQPLSDLQAHDPDWQHHLWRLDNAAFQTMPTLATIVERPYSEYSKRFAEAGFAPAGLMIATDRTAPQAGNPYVGMSTLWPDANNPAVIAQGFTGVHPTYRRRGIATALKVYTIAYAKAHGAKFIVTENAEENAMYQINLRLGFTPQPAWVNLEKKLS